MITKDVIEGLLFVNNNEVFKKKLEICHILDGNDRDWQPVEHTEFHFIEQFVNPMILMIVDKQIRIYVFGEQAKGKTYNVLEIDGFFVTHLTISKSNLLKRIKDNCKYDEKQFMPDSFMQRCIFMGKSLGNPNLSVEENITNSLYVFNRTAMDNKILRKSKWSLGHDIYSVEAKEYDTTLMEILKNCLAELES